MEFLYGFHHAQTLNPVDYSLWDVLGNKTNETSYPNISSLL